MNDVKAFGEIISSSLTSWTIQSWDLEKYPSFGELIYIDYQNNKHLGIIANIETGPKDSGRVPYAFGKTMEELRHEQPHIFHLLHTTVTTLPISYTHKGNAIYEIPKKPVPIHSYAHVCTKVEVQHFFSRSLWMTPFFNLAQQHPLFDELLIALLRNAHGHNALNNRSIQELIDIFCLLNHDDYRKLKFFLQRIEDFIY